MLTHYTCHACGNVAYDPAELRFNRSKVYLNADGLRCMACYQRKWRAKLKLVNRIACGMCAVVFQPKRKDAKFCSNACRQKAHRKTSFAPVANCASDAPKRAPVVTGATIV
jgi:hypothetical protein